MIDLIKVIWAIVPFIKEMLFPNKSFKELIFGNKFVVMLLILILLSFTMNWFLMKRIYAIALDRRNISHPELAASNPVATMITPVVVSAASAASAVITTQEEADRKAREDMKERLNVLFGK